LDEDLHKPLVSEQMRTVLRNTLPKHHKFHKYHSQNADPATASSDTTTTAVTAFTTIADANSARLTPPPLALFLIPQNPSPKSPQRK
jgi:hypothetical protein